MNTRRLKAIRFACLPMLLVSIYGNGANAQSLVAAKILSFDGSVEIRRAPPSLRRRASA
jgi:hypothetical protein